MTLFPLLFSLLFSAFLACIPAPCAQSFDSLTCEQDQGAWQACETSSEAKRSRTRLTQFNYGALKSDAERESYADECAAEDEWSIAVAAKDCAKACGLAGM